MIRKSLLIVCVLLAVSCGPDRTPNDEEENLENTESPAAGYDQQKVNLLCKKWKMHEVFAIDSAGNEMTVSNGSDVIFEFKKNFTFVSTYKTMNATGQWAPNADFTELRITPMTKNGKPANNTGIQVYKMLLLNETDLVYLFNNPNAKTTFKQHYKVTN